MARKLPTTQIDKQRARKLVEIFNARCLVEPGLSQKTLALDLKVSDSTISRIFNGKLAISSSMALALSRRLKCHASAFHDDFIDFKEAESFDEAELFRRFARLAKDDQEAVSAMIRALAKRR